MKHVVTVLTIAVVALSLYACGKKGAASGSPVVGTWKVVEASGTAADMNKGMVYDFKTQKHMKPPPKISKQT